LVDVVAPSILSMIIYFVIYIIVQCLLVYQKDKLTKQENKTEEDNKSLKAITFMAKWFAAGYVVIVIIMLYLGYY
jgi:heme/copper-type cytochrome/quinol oxidase subunit 2